MQREIRRALRRTGYDLVKVEPRLIDFLKDREIDHVIDVGANAGQYGQKIRGHLYRGRITSLEPIREVFQRLESNKRGDTLWAAHNVGAGDYDGDATINVSEDTCYSSIHSIKPGFVETGDPAARPTSTETIKVTKLDTLFPDLTGRIFLKIDTQGHERAVLDGATSMLSRVTAVQMELPCMHVYDDVWSLSEAVARMERCGFSICQIAPVVYSRHDWVSLVEVDVIFGRAKT